MASLDRLLRQARDDYADSQARLRAAWPDDPEESAALAELIDIEQMALAARREQESR